MLEETDALVAGDIEAMERLVRTLLLSGFGTAIHGNSQPASQGEHLISHYADMFGDHGWPESFHGEQIGVTTLTMARLQERLLEGPAPTVHVNGADEAAFAAKYGSELGGSCWKEFAQKRLDAERAKAVNQRLAESWDRIRDAIARITIPAKMLRDVLQRAAAPLQPEDLGWPRPFYLTAVKQAREIRNRYTFLDLAADSGKIEPVATLA
jgi:glycerol-1-phosphate dehydrogenase [NAD(P)+]